MELGARHFTFVSRSGADKPEAARVIRAIEEQGASAQVLRADASNEEAMKKALVEANAERPVRGIVHAAMVLKVSGKKLITDDLLERLLKILLGRDV